MGDLDSALVMYQLALDICLKVLGSEDVDTFLTYNNIRAVKYDMGDHDEALVMYQQALDIFVISKSKERTLVFSFLHCHHLCHSPNPGQGYKCPSSQGSSSSLLFSSFFFLTRTI